MALPCGWLSSLVFQRVATDWTQSGAILAAFQLILAFVMGTLAIRNAFLLSIAGRKLLGWKGFAPLIALWLGRGVKPRTDAYSGPSSRRGELLSVYDGGQHQWSRL
jgi:hypothetical protein